ncbi:DUF2490 domain-containing protein [Algoriphagus sp. oki45]|uniref:DUF2490 domain-containing protein n=1 Tax=Algoriphagus sp. oki45 TaxID=3067294 RepID=UPI0030C6A709
MKKVVILFFFALMAMPAWAQSGPDEDQLGAWYMYFFTKKIGNKGFGIQGDYQFRYWDLGGDQEQLLLRTGFTYRPQNANVMFTLGYAFISSGEFGEGRNAVPENRIYQEVLLPQKVGGRFILTHRFRYEQRWVENQDFRTRYRYNLFVNVPLNGTELKKSVLYLALYNEIFINGQTDIGGGREVERFDRNRTYLGLGYGIRDNLRLQTGWMNQTTSQWSKGQLQLSLHHSF